MKVSEVNEELIPQARGYDTGGAVVVVLIHRCGVKGSFSHQLTFLRFYSAIEFPQRIVPGNLWEL